MPAWHCTHTHTSITHYTERLHTHKSYKKRQNPTANLEISRLAVGFLSLLFHCLGICVPEHEISGLKVQRLGT